VVGSGGSRERKEAVEKVFLLEPDVCIAGYKHAGVKWARRGTRDTGRGFANKDLNFVGARFTEVIQQVLDSGPKVTC